MPTPSLLRCPVRGTLVQYMLEDEPADTSEDTALYRPFECPACLRIHLVNPFTGKTPSEESER